MFCVGVVGHVAFVLAPCMLMTCFVFFGVQGSLLTGYLYGGTLDLSLAFGCRSISYFGDLLLPVLLHNEASLVTPAMTG